MAPEPRLEVPLGPLRRPFTDDLAYRVYEACQARGLHDSRFRPLDWFALTRGYLRL
jgi:hypothetical protein